MKEKKGSASHVSQWKPNMNQLAILEGFYCQGVRIPSPEQLVRITGMLMDYGNVEQNDILLWFLNHMDPQESPACFNHMVPSMPSYQPVMSTRPPPLLPLPPQFRTNVVRNPYAIPRGNIAGVDYYQSPGVGYYQSRPYVPPTTLQLFPLHPDGILENRTGSSTGTSTGSDSNGGGGGGGEKEE